MTELLPYPQSGKEVYRSTVLPLATATGILTCLRLPNNPNFLIQSTVATCPVLQTLLEFLHRQPCRCEKYGGRVREPLRTLAQKWPHTCGLVDEILHCLDGQGGR